MKQKVYLIFVLTIAVLNASHSEKLTKKLLNNVIYFVSHGIVPGVCGFVHYRNTLLDNIEKYNIAFNSTHNTQNMNWSHYYENYSPGFFNNMHMTAAGYLLLYSGYSTFFALRKCRKLLQNYKNKIVKEKKK